MPFSCSRSRSIVVRQWNLVKARIQVGFHLFRKTARPKTTQERSYSAGRSRLLGESETRSRNEEAIYSTRNRIYSLKFFTSDFIDVDTFYLFLNWFSTRVSEDRKYVGGRRQYACINIWKFKGLDSREITSLPEIKKVINMHVISIIAENKPHAHHKNHLHALKVYNTRPSQFC